MKEEDKGYSLDRGAGGQEQVTALLNWLQIWAAAGRRSSSSDGKIAELQDRCSLEEGLGSM